MVLYDRTIVLNMSMKSSAKGLKSMKIIRKDLTPAQFTRSNKVMGASMSLVYMLFIVITVMQKPTLPIPNVLLIISQVTLFIVTIIFVLMNVDKRKAMLFMAYAFTVGYGLLVFTHHPTSMILVFPVLMTMSVYLSEILVMAGSFVTAVICITKGLLLYSRGMLDATSFHIIIIMIFGVVVCLYGGCRAIHLLVLYSKEDKAEIEHEAAHMERVANSVENIVMQLDTEFRTLVKEISEIHTAIENTTDIIDGIASGSESTAEATQHQAEMTGEIQERLEHTNETATGARDTSESLRKIIEEGKKQSDDLELQSNLVDENSQKISQTVSNLVENVNKVSGITDAILSISSQTNLLALNASIEAARAGEAGKGFAVVAEQIRTLAEETKKSTEQITEIMNELIAVTTETREGLDRSVESIDIQREKVKQVHDSFIEVGEGMEELIAGMDSMRDEVEAVLGANQNIVDGIATLSGTSQEISASTTSSKDDMVELKASMEKFLEIVDGTFEQLKELKSTVS